MALPVIDGLPTEAGMPLPGSLEHFFGVRFGQNFSGVRIHTSRAAANAAESLNALAFTAGPNIYFGAAQWSPHSTAGRELIAHELAHTVQQGATTLPSSASQPTIARRASSEVPEVQRQPRPQRRRAPQSITIRWEGSIRASIFAYVRRLARSPEEATRITDLVQGAVNEYSTGGQAVTHQQFERQSHLRGVLLDEPVAQVLRGALGADEHQTALLATAGRMLEETDALITGIAVDDAVAMAERSGHHAPAAAVEANWSVLAGNEDLSRYYLTLMGRFAGVSHSDATTALAQGGLAPEEILQIIGDDGRRRFFTHLFTQGYTEFARSGGTVQRAFEPLEERIFEQFNWGNPTATRNLLQIDHSREGDQIAIVDRTNGVLLYDSQNNPLRGITGQGYRDTGYVGSEPMHHGINIAGISDPVLFGILNALRMDVTEPTRAVARGADFYWHNSDLVKERVIEGLPELVVQRFEEMLPVFVGFLTVHGAATAMLAMPPPFPAIGAAIRGTLAIVGWAMQIDFLGSALGHLVEAGYHLTRIAPPQDGRLDDLSNLHLERAAVPIREMVADVALAVGAEMAGRFLAAVRGRTRLSIECTRCRLRFRVEEPLRLPEGRARALVEAMAQRTGRSPAEVEGMFRLAGRLEPAEAARLRALGERAAAGHALDEAAARDLSAMMDRLRGGGPVPAPEAATTRGEAPRARLDPLTGAPLQAGTEGHIRQRWFEYQQTHRERFPELADRPDPAWERQYRQILTNRIAGGEFQNLALNRLGVPENFEVFMDPSGEGGFRPDGVRDLGNGSPVWGRQYHFVEVKGWDYIYNDTTESLHTENLHAMLDYVETFRGFIEVVVRSAAHERGETRLSRPLEDRLARLVRNGLARIYRFP